jgi:hypothetical protein
MNALRIFFSLARPIGCVAGSTAAGDLESNRFVGTTSWRAGRPHPSRGRDATNAGRDDGESVRRAPSALVVLLLLALPACGPGDPTAAPSSPSDSPSVSPTLAARDAIAAVVAASAAAPSHATERRQFGTNTLTITADYGTGMDRVRYVWDQPKQPAFVAVGDDFYFQKYPKVARPWLHLLRSKLGQASKLPALTNLVPAFTLLGGIVEAEATGRRRRTTRAGSGRPFRARRRPRRESV